MVAKKNRVNIYGSTFHVTPAGKIYPLGNKQNWFTKCMSSGLKGKLNTGENLSQAQLKSNKDKFKEVLDGCKIQKASKPRGRPPKSA